MSEAHVEDDIVVDDEVLALLEESDEERQARLTEDFALDEISMRTVDRILDRLLLVVDELSGHPLYGYQKPFARRLLESLVINDGATVTALFARQSGKSETVANVVAAAMVMLPILSKVFPDLLDKYTEGLWVGVFAPTDEQTDIIFGRIVARLTSEHATEFLADPDIDDSIGKGRGGGHILLKRNGSFIRRQTAHPRASIEGRTYHLMIIDESQDADERVVNKSIAPMGAATNATMVMIGTPSYHKGVFYKTIKINQRTATKRGQRTNHFQADWKEVAKWNRNYERFVKKEMLRVGEDSDEFRLSYRLHWLLDKGMFTTSERLDELGDVSMQTVSAWHKSPVVVGIDPARKQDSTIVTVVWVNWDYVDEFGYYEHRVLNWLDLNGLGWEEQFHRIHEFLANYNIFAVGVDAGGLGDVVIARLQVMMPRVKIEALSSQKPEQSKRWKHLKELVDRGMVGWPAHSKTRRLKTYKRFRTQMEDLETAFEGPYVMAQAPKANDAHDDYADSLAMACVLTQEFTAPEVEVSNNPFYS